MAKSDIQIITDAFLEFGGNIFQQNMLNWDLSGDGIQMRTNVNAPQALTKLSSTGTPRPYRAQDDFEGNGAKYTDRSITAYQSKWDFEFDTEDFRNTYLASKALQEKTMYVAALDFLSNKFKEYLKTQAFYLGVRDAAGDTPVDIANGWGTIIASELVGGGLTAIVTGAITNANALEKVETFLEDASIPMWLREMGGNVVCSYNVFDKYCKSYRTANTFGFKADVTGAYKLDNKNFSLKPVSWMGTSQRLIATINNNAVMGTDLDRIQVHATPHLNIIQTRLMMPVGFEWQDLEAMYVNDQA